MIYFQEFNPFSRKWQRILRNAEEKAERHRKAHYAEYHPYSANKFKIWAQTALEKYEQKMYTDNS